MVGWLRVMIVRALVALCMPITAFGLMVAPLAAAPAPYDVSPSSALQDSAAGTVIVSSYLCDGLDTVVWGGVPDASCWGTSGTFSFDPMGDGGEAVSLQLGASGSGSVGLPAGSYEVYEVTADGPVPGSAVDILAGETTVLNVLHPSGEPVVVLDTPVPEPTVPVVTTGWVEVTNYYCPGVSAVSLDGSLVDDNCRLGDATLAFYLYGDGSDEYWPLYLGGDGVGSIELIAGTYAMVEQGRYTEFDFDVPAGETVSITLVQPDDPVPSVKPRVGVVQVSSYACPDVTAASYDVSGVTDACTLMNGTFVFRLAQGGTAEEWSLTVGDDGIGTIELAAGVYDMVDQATSAKTVVTVQPDATVAVGLVRPAVDPEQDVDVQIVALSCDSVSTTEFTLGTGTQDAAPANDGCTSGAANLSFTETSESTGAVTKTRVEGSATVQLGPGTYDVVEEGTRAQYRLEVPPAEQVVLTVSQPAPGGAQKPEQRLAPKNDQRTPESAPVGDARSTSSSTGVLVTKLPNVGSGSRLSVPNSSMAASIASALCLAGALTMRHKRS